MLIETQKNDFVQKGKALFYNKQNYFFKKDQFNSKLIRKQLNSEKWVINYKKYQENNWKHIFQEMTSAQIGKLWLNTNQYPQIIKQISHVRFDQLKILALHQNKITNIEQITFIHSPNLNQIWLSFASLILGNNYINSLKSLRKLYTSQLLILYLEDNPILQIQALCQVKFNTVMTEISLKSAQFNIQSITPFVKINAQDINYLEIQGGYDRQIERKKLLLRIFNKRFPNNSNDFSYY